MILLQARSSIDLVQDTYSRCRSIQSNHLENAHKGKEWLRTSMTRNHLLNYDLHGWHLPERERVIFQGTSECVLNFCPILVILPKAWQQIAAAHEGTLVQTSGVKTKLLCLGCLGAPPASHPNLRNLRKVILWSSGVCMSKLESSYVTIGTTQPNATDQITMASPNRLLWQVWATGSPGC